MRSVRRRRSAGFSAVLLGAALVGGLTAGCSASEASPDDKDHHATDKTTTTKPAPEPAPEVVLPPDPLKLTTAKARGSRGVVAAGGSDAPYNYAPSVLSDGGRYRMWWCSQLGIARPAGDDILLAEARSLNGPFVGPDRRRGTPVFSGHPGRFDGVHTCDPSVIHAGGTYFMYYTGAAGNHAHGNAIGLATSSDGRVWHRANDGRPIITPAREVDNGNTYGTGQPSAVYLAGKFYLMFTDTTGRYTGHNGAGQFVLRSPDPKFRKNVEALGQDGFQPVAGTHARLRTVVDAFSADWMWVDSLAAFAIAHETRGGTTITFWDLDFRTNPYKPVVVPGNWKEGPGLVRRPDGHAAVSTSDPCGTVSIDLVRATRQGRHGPTDLRHYGLDVHGFNACQDKSRALLALNGFAMPSPQRTIDLIVGGMMVRVDRRSVAERLAVRILDKPVPALADMPVAARLVPGAQVGKAPDRGLAFVLDGKLWRIASTDIATLNSSVVGDMSAPEWDSYERGPDLVGPPR